jgi:8-oxo-dGTP diphosphatase
LSYCYDYERPAVSADIAVFRRQGNSLQILLILRKNEPYRGMWALPGGFMEINETLEQTAVRELEEETGLKDIELTQFRTFSQVDRDPRTRIITTVFFGEASAENTEAKGGDDAAEAKWYDIDHLPALGFDHAHIIELIIANLGK